MRTVTENVGKNWSGVRGFEASPKRQFVTESININSLADHRIWSTIKTLPASLPEPSSMDHGPRTRVTGTVSLSDLDYYKILKSHNESFEAS